MIVHATTDGQAGIVIHVRVTGTARYSKGSLFRGLLIPEYSIRFFIPKASIRIRIRV